MGLWHLLLNKCSQIQVITILHTLSSSSFHHLRVTSPLLSTPGVKVSCFAFSKLPQSYRIHICWYWINYWTSIYPVESIIELLLWIISCFNWVRIEPVVVIFGLMELVNLPYIGIDLQERKYRRNYWTRS
jgi:hypothetical protein